MKKKQEELLSLISNTSNINEVQEYIRKVITLRGFSEQRVQDEILLLMEETGELAKAIRKTLPNMTVDHNKIDNYTDVEEEIADVFIVLVSICNKLNINLYESFKKKEEKNIKRKWDINKE